MNVAAIIVLFYFRLAAGFLSSLIKKKKESITCHVEQWVNLNSFCLLGVKAFLWTFKIGSENVLTVAILRQIPVHHSR